MLTNVLNAPLTIQPDKSISNNNAEVATVSSDDLPDEKGKSIPRQYDLGKPWRLKATSA